MPTSPARPPRLYRLRALGLLVGLSVLGQAGLASAADCPSAEPEDPLRVYLISAGAGPDLFSSFGHSALWVSGGGLKKSAVFNWGSYNTAKLTPPELLGGFLAGTMEYWLSTRSFSNIARRFEKEDRSSVLQRIDLPPAMLDTLSGQLREAALDPDPTYIYHWVERNCATQIRDLLDRITQGQIRAQLDGPADTTHRREVLRHLSPRPLSWFGWHFTTNRNVDLALSRWESMYLPIRLKQELEAVEIDWSPTDRRPLLAETCSLSDGHRSWPAPAPPVRWPWLLAIGGTLGALLTGLGSRAGRGPRVLLGVLISILGGVLGLLGTLSMALWLSSVLAGFGPNENWLVANPLSWSLVGIGAAIARDRRRNAPRLATISMGLAGLASLSLVLAPLSWPGQENLAVLCLFIPALAGATWAIRSWARRAPER